MTHFSRLRGASLLAVGLALLITTSALAHAVVTRTDPVDGSVLAEAPKQVRLWFSEEVAVSLSKFVVSDNDGRQVPLSSVRADETDPGLIILDLPDLEPGVYRIAWDVLSTDDLHFRSGSIVFGVQTAADGAAVAQADFAPQPIEVLVRWIDFIALTTIVGAVAVLLLSPSTARLEKRLLTLALGATMASLFTGGGGIVTQAITLSNSGAGGLTLGEAILQLLTQTSYGSRWLMREGWSLALLFIVVWQRRQFPANRLMVGATLPLLIALTVLQAMNGHATTFNDDSLVRVVADAVHLFSAGLWVGGLTALVVAAVPLLRRGPEEAALARSILRRFGLLASASLGALLVTGLYNSAQQVASIDALLFTLYGQALVLKIGLVFGVGAIGLINSALLHPRVADVIRRILRRPIGWRPIAPRHVWRTVTIEAIGAGSIVLLAAVLGSSQPARGPEFDPPSDDAALKTVSTNVDGLMVSFSIKPNRPGQNFISIGAYNTRRPAPAPITAVNVRLTPPGNEAAIDLEAALTGEDQYQITGHAIATPGEWQMTIDVERPGRQPATWTFPWTVMPASPYSPRPVRVSNQPLAPWLEGAAVLSALLLAGTILTSWLRGRQIEPGVKSQREYEHDIRSIGTG